MKNYLDLLGTDLYLDLVLVVEPVGAPETEIWINQQMIYQGQLLESITVSEQLPLLSEILISVKLKNKVYNSDSETAVVLKKLSIDGFDIIPNWSQLANYINDHNTNSPTSYLGFNGEWKFQITQPFYQWKHQVNGQGWLLQPNYS